MKSPANDAHGGAISVASLSDVGRVRTVNEDSCESLLRSDGACLLVVADGMGGHRGGATASREAVATIAAAFSESDSNDAFATLRGAIERANDHVFSMAREDPELAGMGTTVVALLVDAGGRATVAHVGDSRAYRWRGGRLEPLTTDHSVVAEMQRRGVLSAEEAAYHPRRNEILRSVGVLSEVEVELASVEVAPGDWVLLCSDGLCGVVSDAEVEEVLAGVSSPDAATRALVELANECGGPDNVTVQILALAPDWSAGSGAGHAPPDRSAAAEPASSRTSSPAANGEPGRRSRWLATAVIVLAILALGSYWIARLR